MCPPPVAGRDGGRARKTPPPRTVAAFDFDGTITRHDTLLPFLAHLIGRRRTVQGLLLLSAQMPRAMAGGASRDVLKANLLYGLLAGQPADALERAGESFADHLLAGRLRVDTLERIRAHQEAGHELVMVSASPELYVTPMATRLGFVSTLATRLEVGPDGLLTGRLAGRNCRGPEKVRRLQEWLGEETPVVLAYGDSRGDREMLAFAGAGGTWLTRRARYLRSRPTPPVWR
jgi:phosphatidylglycerophosphatase C